MLPVESPFKTYTGLDGKPLHNGYVFFGLPNQNPVNVDQQVTVYWDLAGTIPASQPLRTLNGYIVRAGTPANVFIDQSYSEIVQDSKKRQVMYARNSADFSFSDILSSLANFSGQLGSSLIGFLQDAIGAVSRTVLAKLRERVTLEDFGAVGNGVADDTSAILKAMASKKKEINGVAGSTYLTKTRIIPSNGQSWIGNGAVVVPNFSDLPFRGDVFHLPGSETVGSEAKNIKVIGWNIDATGRANVGFGIQVEGESYTNKPHDIELSDNTTKNCLFGGIFVSSASRVKVLRNVNDGGNRGVGTKAPISTPANTSYIQIDGNTCRNTTEYGIQTYYGFAIGVHNNIIEGSDLMVSGDQSCITVDRSIEVSVTGNTVRNAPRSQVFVTGSKDVTVTGNTCVGGEGGIQVIYNLETVEDAAIKECLHVVVADNACNFNSNYGVIFNGVQYGIISGNSLRGGPAGSAVVVMDQTRSDGVIMNTSAISISDNKASGRPYTQITVNGGADISLVSNTFSSYDGLQDTTFVMDGVTGNALRLGGKTIQDYGYMKRVNMPSDITLTESRLADETYHKGYYTRYAFGQLIWQDSSGNGCFAIGVGEGANKKDIGMVKPGAGLIAISPDGTKTMRIGISNTGAVVATVV